ncbi:hypothetical protein DITRI_Ditri12bG0011100 [Diplodiscus trichospermus]
MAFVQPNLMTFLTDFWNLKLKEATTIVNLYEGLKDMLEVNVVVCIDAWLGYRWMLILSSVLYTAGLGLLAFSVPQYFFKNEQVCPAEKVHCFKKLIHTPFWEGLALLVAGGATQGFPLDSLSFKQTKVVKAPEHYEATRIKVRCFKFKVKPGGWPQFQQKFIRWLCYGFLKLGILMSVYGFVFAKHNWHLRFLISAVSIVIGLLWFLCGFPFYGPRRLQPSPLLTRLRALIAAMRKRHLNYQEYSEQLHRGYGDDQNQHLTDHLEWLNKAAVEEPAADNGRWRVCSVKEVEETKILLNIFPMSMTFIVYGMVKSLGNTFFTEQVNSVRGAIPTIVFQMIQELSKSAVKTVFKFVFEKRIRRMKRQYTDGMKIGIGMLASIICSAVASSVESKRLKALSKKGLSHDPNTKIPYLISPFWFVLQFFFLGAMDGLAGDGIQDFFGHYAPDSRRYGPVFTRSVTGFGTVLNIAFIAILDCYSKSRHDASWLGDSINQSRLDFIYRTPEEQEEIPFLEVKQEEEAPLGDQQNQQGQADVQLQKISLHWPR